MKHLLVLLMMGFCAMLPVSAQIPNVRDAVSRKVDEAAAAARAKRMAKGEAVKASQHQVEEQIETVTQLGVRKNREQVKRLENSYGVKDLEKMVEAKPARKASGGAITKSRSDVPWKRKTSDGASSQATSSEMKELKALAKGGERIATTLKNVGSVEGAHVANQQLWQNGALGEMQTEAKENLANPKVKVAGTDVSENAARIDSVKKAAKTDSLKKAADSLRKSIADNISSGKTPSGLDKVSMMAARNKVVADFLKKGAAPAVETALIKKGYVDVPANSVRSLQAAGSTPGLKVRCLKNGIYRISFDVGILQAISKTIVKKRNFPAKNKL